MKNAVRSVRVMRIGNIFTPNWSAGSHKKRSAFLPFLLMLLGMGMFSVQANAAHKFWSSDIQNGDRFGFAVAQDGSDAIVGAHGEDADGSNAGAAYVFSFDGTSYVQEDKLTAGADGAPNDKFGWAVDISGDYAIVGAPYENDKGFGTGVAYIFERVGGVWSKVATLRPGDLKKGHFFGYSVAISGDYAIVGALGDDDMGDQSGTAYVYELSGGSWTFLEKIYADDAGPNDYFGFSVDIDGDYAVVGAHRNDDDGLNSGSAYVYHLMSGSFTQQAELTASDAMPLDSFGYQVAISGERVIVGAPGVDDVASNAGAAYVFHRSGSSWGEEDKLTASDGEADDYFGWSVAISGPSAMIGAWGDDDAGHLQGAAYSFARSGASWLEQDKFVEGGAGISMQNLGFDVSIAGDYAMAGAKGDDEMGPNSGAAFFYKVNEGVTCLIASNGDSFDRLGHSVDINGDWAIAGAHTDETSATIPTAGSAYIYMRSGLTWSEDANITPSDPATGDRFGWSVGIDGDYAVVGAPNKTVSGLTIAGAVYVFRNDGGSWTQIQKLTAPTPKGGDFYGYNVKIHGDYIIVGALGDDDEGTQAGAAYIYVLDDPTTFVLQQKIVAADAVENDYFGQSVDIYGSDVVVGAPKKDSDEGAAYVFTRSGTTWTQEEKLVASDGAAGDSLAWSVAIAPDYVNLGAPGEEAAYVYHRSAGSWGTEQEKLTASDAAPNDQFGWAVGITTSIAVVGAFRDDDSHTNTGSAYIYRRSLSTWSEDVKLVDMSPNENEQFGRAVSISESTAMIGIPFDINANGAEAGGVCFYRLPTGSPMLVPNKELTALESIEGNDVQQAPTETIQIQESNAVQPLDAVLYPNPSNGIVTVEFTMSSVTPANLQVLNMAGQVVYSSSNIQVEGFATERINLSHLTNGVYLVNINNGEEQIVRKLILNK
ncbi:MAG: T9SS type A sorting domain-containing protein [Bacteroidia bacterium]